MVVDGELSPNLTYYLTYFCRYWWEPRIFSVRSLDFSAKSRTVPLTNTN